MAKILLVEDDKQLADLLDDLLREDGHSAEISTNGNDGQERLQYFKYDLVILDWDLPGITGCDICKAFRGAGGTTPILMLTGKNSIDNKEAGLNAGADDYLTKPFHPRELAARLRALLRRPTLTNHDILKAGELVLEPGAKRLTKNGVQTQLKPREFALLEFLMRHANQTFSANQLMDHVWSSDSEASPDTVRLHVMRIRAKIDSDGQESMIRTIPRVGYKFVSV